MTTPTQLIYRTTAMGLCRLDWNEQPKHFRRIECLRCGDLPIPAAQTSADYLSAVVGKLKKTNEPSPD